MKTEIHAEKSEMNATSPSAEVRVLCALLLILPVLLGVLLAIQLKFSLCVFLFFLVFVFVC